MNWKKHMLLVVGGGLALLLLLVAVVLLMRMQSRFGALDGELQSSRATLERLNRRMPFPSAENIEKTAQQAQAMRDQALALQERLRQSQLLPEQIDPAAFTPRRERTIQRLAARAAELGIQLPIPFAFAFERYASGELPPSQAVPRLTVQLQAVDLLCELLFQSRIDSVVSLQREVFEDGAASTYTPAPGARSRRGAVAVAAPVAASVPPAGTNELYGAERFTVEFTAREQYVWDVLNALAVSPQAFSVVDVQVKNTLAEAGKLGVAQPPQIIAKDKPPEGAPVNFSLYPSHEDRVLAGREPLSVSLVIDLYTFADAFGAVEGKP